MSAPVTVCCLTFNHAPYIEKTLEGFLLQKTTFPVRFLIHDDASKDGAQDILRAYQERYPGRFEMILQSKNQWSQGVNVFETEFLPRCEGPYMATCEGDDYWTDPFKLQRQMEYLEAHPQVAMVHTDFAIDCPPGHDYLPFYTQMRKRRKSGWIFGDLFLGNFISTPTTMYRKDVYVKTSQKITEEKLDFGIDYMFWLEFAREHEIHFLPETTTVYRIHAGGMSHNRDFMDKTVGNILRYHLKNSLEKKHFSSLSLTDQWELGNRVYDLAQSLDPSGNQRIKAILKSKDLIGWRRTMRILATRITAKFRK